MPPRPDNVQICIDSRLSVIAFCQNEKERTHAHTSIFRPLSYMWGRSRGMLCSAFRCSSLRSTHKPEVCSYRGHREEIRLTPDYRTSSSDGLSVVLHFVSEEAWRFRCSSRFSGGGVHLILANPSWRQLQERAEKIPGDKKHVEGMVSQSHCVAQFNTAHELPSSGR
jgi:hypothetical protein